MFFLKLSLWRRSLSRVKLSVDLQKKSKRLFLCDTDMRIRLRLCNWIRMSMIFMNRYWKQRRPVTMLKKRLHLRCFLASSVNFYITTAFETFCELFNNFWMTVSRSFIIETRLFLLRFFESDENHFLHSRGKRLY